MKFILYLQSLSSLTGDVLDVDTGCVLLFAKLNPDKVVDISSTDVTLMLDSAATAARGRGGPGVTERRNT